jgi:hypothetical protein
MFVGEGTETRFRYAARPPFDCVDYLPEPMEQPASPRWDFANLNRFPTLAVRCKPLSARKRASCEDLGRS